VNSEGKMTSSPTHCEARSNPQQAGNDLCSMGLHRRALGRAGPVTFFLIKKQPKNQVSREASFPHRPLPCKPGRTTGCNYFSLLRTHSPELLQKLAMPFPALKATIVLPAFTRSLPADETPFIYHVMGSLSKHCGRVFTRESSTGSD